MKNIKNNKKMILIIPIILAVLGYYVLFQKDEDKKEIDIIDYNETTKDKELNVKNTIKVYITGAVKNPGVYDLEENSRIADVIEKAGGLIESANVNAVNLAEILEDGIKVYIPNINDDLETENDTMETNMQSNKSINSNTSTNRKININTANQSDLETLPGIGTTTATKIIDYRKENGKFKNIEDIKKVKGIRRCQI